MKGIFNLIVEKNWNKIKNYQSEIRGIIANLPEPLITDILMASTELIENAIKYSQPVPECQNIRYHLVLEPNQVLIRVVSGVSDYPTIQNAIRILDKIQTTENPEGLFHQRIYHLINNTKSEFSQLGLYRIAHEGQFKLDYFYYKTVFSITAHKEILIKKELDMQDFEYKELTLVYSLDATGNEITIQWKGCCLEPNPKQVLSPYFETIIEKLFYKKVILDYKELESINSAFVIPILNLLNLLNKNGIPTRIYYYPSISWQKTTFESIYALSNQLKNIEVIAKE